MSAELLWKCVAHHPARWKFGVLKGTMITESIAEVECCKSGAWTWLTYTDDGVAPRRIDAMYSAEETLKKR